MNVRRLVATVVVGGVLGVGIGGVAAAEAAPTVAPNPAAGATCQQAEARLGVLKDRLTAINARLARLAELIQKAKDAHHDDRVIMLEARRVRVQAAHDRVTDRINRIENRCGI